MSGPIVHAVMYRDYELGTLCQSKAWGPPTMFSAVTDDVTCPGCRFKIDGVPEAPTPTPRAGVSLVVTHITHQTTFYEVLPDQGWRVDPAMRCIVVGRGIPRTYVPLDGVLYFTLEESR